MDISVMIHSVSLLFALLVSLILLLNIRRNPYINAFILLVILSNLVRIPYYLSYILGWQSAYSDVPKPFNIFFLANSFFFYQYLKSMLRDLKFDFKELYVPLSVPVLLFVINMLMPKEAVFQVILRGINYPIVIGYILFYVYKSYLEISKGLWTNNKRSIRFSNFKLIRTWLTALFILFVLLAIRLSVSYSYELFTQKVFINQAFQPIHSLLWIFIYIVFFIHPEILYGLQRVNLVTSNVLVDNELIFKPDFKWRTIPKAKQNKMDIQLSVKLDRQLPEIIKKLESKTALRHIVKDPNINIDSLSEKLNIPKSHVQYVFKYYADFTFVTYRTRIRVFYALSKMKEDYLSKNTMDALARESGFSSYNPFYAAFKAEMGVGPSEVLAQLKQSFNQSQEL
jgi:AraC-like DNA-binding protein